MCTQIMIMYGTEILTDIQLMLANHKRNPYLFSGWMDKNEWRRYKMFNGCFIQIAKTKRTSHPVLASVLTGDFLSLLMLQGMEWAERARHHY